MKNKFRASASILWAWSRGDWENAVNMYFKLTDFDTPAMKAGREYHKKWEDYINNYEKMPEVFGGEELENPLPEIKLESQLSPWLELVGILDCYSNGILYEFKTGGGNSQGYSGSPQLGIYALLLKLNGYPVHQAVVHHYNQHLKQATSSYVWITDKVIQDALDYIETYSSEMHNYLEENNLYEELGKKKKD